MSATSVYTKQHNPKLFDVNLCREAYLAKEENPDMTPKEIADLIGSTKSQVEYWINRPERFSPFVDDVAVDRALREKAVYDALSILEKNIFWDRWAPVIKQEYLLLDSSGDATPTRDAILSLLGIEHEALRNIVERWVRANDGTGS